MAEVSTKDLPRNLFKVTRVAVEIVRVGVEVDGPSHFLGDSDEPNGATLLKRWKRLDAMMHVAEFLPALGADHKRGLKKALNDLVGAGPAMKYDVDGQDKQAKEEEASGTPGGVARSRLRAAGGSPAGTRL